MLIMCYSNEDVTFSIYLILFIRYILLKIINIYFLERSIYSLV